MKNSATEGRKILILLTLATLASLAIYHFWAPLPYAERLVRIQAEQDLGRIDERITAEPLEIQAQLLDYSSDQELTLKAWIALSKYDRSAREIFQLYGSEPEFKDILRTYGDAIIPVIQYFRDHEVGFHQRVQPIVADVSYTPRPELSLALREDYQLGEGNRSFLFSGTRGDELGSFLSLGAGYNKATANQYYMNADFGWLGSSHTLRLGGALRSVAVTDHGPGGLHGWKLFEKEVSVSKQWHDFFTRLIFRLRPGGVKEDRKSTRLNSSHSDRSRMPSSA